MLYLGIDRHGKQLAELTQPVFVSPAACQPVTVHLR
jgi:hypothetical protein